MEVAPNIAIFCDFENVAIGVRDAHYEAFQINLILERLLDKGNIVVKKAYADWDRYKSAKRPMHEAAFELIEIPHISYSGKNSADIRMVVDALDLCYTKAHVDMFVIVSGDSDFSPLVSKLRENNKKVIGVGVKNASSDLLMDNCDEFIYYDDLVREKRNVTSKEDKRRAPQKGREKNGKAVVKKIVKKAPEKGAKPTDLNGEVAAEETPRSPADEMGATEAVSTTLIDEHGSPLEVPKILTDEHGSQVEAPKTQADEHGSKQEALELVLDTVESLFRERDDNLWGSMIKQTLKRKRPRFAETFYGYRTFNHLLEDAQKQGLLEIQKDAKSGGYLVLSFDPNA